MHAGEQRRPHRRARVARPESPHLGLLEDVVAGEELICSLSGQDDLVAAVPDGPREGEHRRRRRPEQGLLGELHGPAEPVGYGGAVHVELMQVDTPRASAIVLCASASSTGEPGNDRPNAWRRPGSAGCQRDDDGRVEAPAEVGGDGNVRAHTQPDGVVEQLEQLLRRLVRGAARPVGLRRRRTELPPALAARRSRPRESWPSGRAPARARPTKAERAG